MVRPPLAVPCIAQSLRDTGDSAKSVPCFMKSAQSQSGYDIERDAMISAEV